MAKKKAAALPQPLLPARPVEGLIRVIRGQRVMLDRDLAALYGVKPIALRQQVKRNRERFPDDFLFQLTQDEAEALVSQSVIPTRRSLGGSLPYVFTQEGIAMLSSVLRSPRAVQMNIMIMRAFVRLRELVAANQDLAGRIDKLEHGHAYTSSLLEALLDDLQGMAQEIREMKTIPDPPKRRIGFKH